MTATKSGRVVFQSFQVEWPISMNEHMAAMVMARIFGTLAIVTSP